MANAVAESLDPDAMANLVEEKNEPDENQNEEKKDEFVRHGRDLPTVEELRIEEEDQDFYTVTGMCLNCGRKGHAAADCPEPTRVDVPEQERARGQQEGRL